MAAAQVFYDSLKWGWGDASAASGVGKSREWGMGNRDW